jgi:hypothetical protein
MLRLCERLEQVTPRANVRFDRLSAGREHNAGAGATGSRPANQTFRGCFAGRKVHIAAGRKAHIA